ncbi:HAD family phosphatase [Candidatus Parcubacteria bacterium]|nr:HAD family phosphatase [Candidatus Parcubacteria bacterium]
MTLITDMDGVVINTQPIHARLESEILFQMLGRRIPEEEISRLFTGAGTKLMFEHYLGDQWDEALARKNEALNLISPDEIRSIEILGATDFYRWYAHTTKTEVALASGSSPTFIQIVLDALDLTDTIKTFVSGEEVERPKPYPDIFELAMKRLRLDAVDCWTIEDSPHGIKAAKACGMRAVGLTTSFTKEMLFDAEADLVAGSFAELREILDLN